MAKSPQQLSAEQEKRRKRKEERRQRKREQRKALGQGSSWNITRKGSQAEADLRRAMDLGYRGTGRPARGQKKEPMLATEWLGERDRRHAKQRKIYEEVGPTPGMIQMPDVEKLRGGGYKVGGEALTESQYQDYISRNPKDAQVKRMLEEREQLMEAGRVDVAAQERVAGEATEIATEEQAQQLRQARGLLPTEEERMEPVTTAAEIIPGAGPRVTEAVEQKVKIEKQAVKITTDKWGMSTIRNASREELKVFEEVGIAPKPEIMENGDLHIPGNAMSSEFYKQIDAGDITQEQYDAIRELGFNFPMSEEEAEAFIPYENEKGGIEYSGFVITKSMQKDIFHKKVGVATGTAIGTVVGAFALKGAIAGSPGGPLGIAIGVAAGVIAGVITHYSTTHFATKSVVATEAKGVQAQMRQRYMTVSQEMQGAINLAQSGLMDRAEAEALIKEKNDMILQGIAELKRQESSEESKYWQEPHPYREKLVNYHRGRFYTDSVRLLAATENPGGDVVPIDSVDHDILGESTISESKTKMFGII